MIRHLLCSVLCSTPKRGARCTRRSARCVVTRTVSPCRTEQGQAFSLLPIARRLQPVPDNAIDARLGSVVALPQQMVAIKGDHSSNTNAAASGHKYGVDKLENLTSAIRKLATESCQKDKFEDSYRCKLTLTVKANPAQMRSGCF
jgi:hypothetical protein